MPPARKRQLGFGLAFPLCLAGLLACGDAGNDGPTESSSGELATTATTAAPGADVAIAGALVGATTGSSIALLDDPGRLIIADEDHRALRIIASPFGVPRALEAKVTSLPLDGAPAQVIARGGRVLVTVRDVNGEGALLAFRAEGAGLEETHRVSLPYDAWGLAVDPAMTYALVTSAWSNTVTRVDLTTFEASDPLAVAREPRGIAVHPQGDRAYVSHLMGTEVTRVDGLTAGSLSAQRVALPASAVRTFGPEPNHASLGYSVVLDPSGERVWFPRHALGAAGGDAWFGTAAVDGLALPAEAPLAPVRTGPLASTRSPRFAMIAPFPWVGGKTTYSEVGVEAFIQPRAAVYRASQNTLLVASEGTDALVELDASLMDPTFGVIRTYDLGNHDSVLGVAEQGGAPTGIALSPDESVAYVHCRSTDEVLRVGLVAGEETVEPLPPVAAALAVPLEDESLSNGRKLFYNATDSLTSGGLACAGCHPEGRDDGHVWHEVEVALEGHNGFVAGFEGPIPTQGEPIAIFLGGPGSARELLARWPDVSFQNAMGPERLPTAVGFARQTPMLAGRVNAAGPYGWHAENKTLHDRIMAGFGLHRWGSAPINELGARARAGHLATFLREGLVPPAPKEAPMSESAKRGEAIFLSEQAQCKSCHVPATEYTDRGALPLREAPRQPAFATEDNRDFKTPSLRFVGSTPPYFHDGRYESLEELVEKNADGMGKTSHLSPEQRKDLVAFLETL